jgi:hypothetical protein
MVLFGEDGSALGRLPATVSFLWKGIQTRGRSPTSGYGLVGNVVTDRQTKLRAVSHSGVTYGAVEVRQAANDAQA